MPRLRVTLRHPGMREVLRSAGVGRELKRRADRVVQQAQGVAPVDTGAYRASIRAEVDTGRERARARVIAGGGKVDYAITLEAHLRVLGRSIDAARG